MKQVDLVNAIKAIGLPVAYHHYPIGQAPALPYVVYYFPNNNDMIADNTNYCPITALNIELYTDNKDIALEDTLGDALNSLGLVYAKTETYIETDKMYQILYESGAMING